jgi:hypothetical protein
MDKVEDGVAPSSPEAVNDPDLRILIERDQHVIIVPDSMEANPSNIEWLTDRNAYHCRVLVLGQILAHKRVSESTPALYREWLKRLIAGGVRVIHEKSLDETNRKYLEVYPDAEGSRIRRAKPFNQWTAPFEVDVPANTCCTMDIAWPSEAKQVAASVSPLQDEGQEWGLGLALGWPDGQYVQINARIDGRWGIRRNGVGYLCGSYEKGKTAIVAIVLDHKRVELNAEVTGFRYIAEFPRSEFPTVPATVRLGKIGKTWEPQDAEDKGAISPCRVDWVKIY